MLLSDWMKLPKEQREAHLDLSTPCELRKTREYNGMPGGQPRRPHKSEQIKFHGLIDDVAYWKGTIYRCHLCENGSQQGFCSNPRHIRLGTQSENNADKTPEQKAAFAKAGTDGRKGRKNKKNGHNKHRAISTIDGHYGMPRAVGAHHRPYNIGKGERQLIVPEEDHSAYETLTPLQRMLAMEMSFA
jgi:hypothetical protein